MKWKNNKKKYLIWNVKEKKKEKNDLLCIFNEDKMIDKNGNRQ